MDALFAAPIGALLIFCLRVIDVSLAVFRMIVAVRGRRGLAALIGFFEVLVWVVAVAQALEHLDSWVHLVGYAAGFAAGNYVGVWLAEHLVPRQQVIRAIFRDRPGVDGRPPAWREAAERLRAAGYAVTEVTGRGRDSNVEILIVMVPARETAAVIQRLQEADPEVFISVDDASAMIGGYVRPGGRKMPFPARV
ncbi:DUF2179 domain-containing protein [Rhodocaloribacter litoris]|uniref:DUF2179 domain-containing protein n=1 Tax=Rhodocaloribacter litoris TaxID=2558931 RepID=UPI00141F8F1F|nr:DUF5698 domain-containing protein [Rhodocaloribacter litoris]QXD17099.1 DUF2179 domain-containing protein [Rhodocaloribacter litoris]GIV60117.1 MAG: hypothetical protein KatS3mg043_1206 [Rhodothermaceae bacterium]